MDFKSYQAIDAINASFLKACAQSEWHGWMHLHGPKTESEAMNLGSAVHTYILEPHLFEKEWAISKKFDGRTTIGKLQRHEFEAQNKDKRLIDEDEFKLLEKIRRNIYSNPVIRTCIEESEKEKTYQWEMYGIKNKARLDIVGKNYFADLKTTKDASPKEFAKAVINFGYHIQMFHYHRPVGDKKNIFAIAAETTTGEVAVYNLNSIVFSEYTERSYDRAMSTALKVKQMQECPPKYSQEIISLELPNWAKE